MTAFDSTNPFDRITADNLITRKRFLGEFKATYDTGEPKAFVRGDMVLYEGKVFAAQDTIIGESPDTNSLWFPYGGSRVSYRDTQPPDPRTGDTWVNSTTGKFYTFIDDGETKQFVEL